MKETTFHRFYQFNIPFNIIVNNCINGGPQYNHSMTQQSVDGKSNVPLFNSNPGSDEREGKNRRKKKGNRRGIPMIVFKILKESQINSHTLTKKSLFYTRHPPLPLNIGVSPNGAVKGIRT